MADEKEKPTNGILKAIASSLVGMISGAVIMYVSPLVNSAIKPPRPVPNFSCTLEGPVATFNNRSTGGTQGWWDFGDGSALEAFSPNQATVTHKFPSPGNYTVKLSLHNLIGEEAERTAPVKVDSAASAPAIDDFQVTAITSNRPGSAYPCAPATFRVTAKLKNADFLLWSIDDQPLELVGEVTSQLEHYVTFASYGPKKIRLLAVGGKNKAEQSADVWVDVPHEEPTILIQQASYAVKAKTAPISVSFPAAFNGSVYPFEVSRKMNPDTLIVEANIERPSEQLVRNPKLTIAADKRSFTVSGELLRNAGQGGVPASWFSKVDLKVANQAAGTGRIEPVSALLTLPGRTVVPMPKTTGMAGSLEWELRQGMDVVYKDNKLPFSQVVRLKDRTYRVTLTTVGPQVQVDAIEAAVPVLSTSSPRP